MGSGLRGLGLHVWLGWGLVHEIKADLFPAGAELISIQFQEQQK
jgi:hypothetical protein